MAYISDNNVHKSAAQAENLTVAYGRKAVLWDVSIDFPEGKLIAIMGPNGAGKSTLMKTMLGVVKKVSGDVRFFPGEQNTTLSANRHRIAYVPQCGSVDWDFPVTALDVVTMGTYGKIGLIKRPGAHERSKAQDMLRAVGMEAYQNRQISKLSGGQQQRLFIARALIQNADLYFLDEPFKGVDAGTERTVMELLRSLKAQGKTVVVVHHDLQTAPEYFDHIVFLNVCVCAQGDINSVFCEKNLRLTYGDSGRLWCGERQNG